MRKIYVMKRNIIASLIVVFLVVALVTPTLLFRCKGDGPKDDTTSIVPPSAVPVSGFSHMDTFPHDTSFYTQGFAFYKGELYEGTGDPTRTGKSKLMKIDLKTGKPLIQKNLYKQYFGEGVTILRDTVYQLTWQEHKVLVYSAKNLDSIKSFDLATEGWGLTNDGQRLIVSTGSGMLYYYNPTDFKLLSKSSIMEGNSETFNLNELEYIDGYVYANQYEYPYLLKIDPAAGRVVAKFDFTDLWKRAKAIKPDVDVPNGIAYDETTKKIYVTGKLWPEVYEIKLGQ